MTSAAPTMPHEGDRLPLLSKAGWGLGSVGTQVILFAQSLLLLYYFTVILGLEPALAGTILFGAKLFDAALAPIVGTWSDRTDTRWGRRRPFMFAGAILCAAGLSFIFNAPSAQPLVLLAGLMLISLGYSFFNIPYIAMPAEMTDSPTERTSIMAWRIACVGFGTMIATSVLPLLVKAWGGGRVGLWPDGHGGRDRRSRRDAGDCRTHRPDARDQVHGRAAFTERHGRRRDVEPPVRLSSPGKAAAVDGPCCHLGVDAVLFQAGHRQR